MVVQIREAVTQVGESRQVQDTPGKWGACGQLLFLEGQRKISSVRDVLLGVQRMLSLCKIIFNPPSLLSTRTYSSPPITPSKDFYQWEQSGEEQQGFSGSGRAAMFYPSVLVWSSLNKSASMEKQPYVKMLRSREIKLK